LAFVLIQSDFTIKPGYFSFLKLEKQQAKKIIFSFKSNKITVQTFAGIPKLAQNLKSPARVDW